MWFFTLGGSAVVPSILLFWYIHSRDIHPEPRGMLMGTFALGAATAIPVVIVVFALNAVIPPPEGVWLKATWTAFVNAAIPEEVFKFLVLMTFCYPSRHFDEPFDGIVYGATASLGFATLENILYVSQGGLGVAIMRAFTAVPGHAFTGVVMGYFVGRAKFAPQGRAGLAFRGLFYATVLHGLYDLFLLTGTTWAVVALPVLVLEIVLGILLIRRMRVDGFIAPADERARAGGLPPVVAPAGAYAPQGQAPYAAPYPSPVQAPAAAPAALPVARGVGIFRILVGAFIASVGALGTLAALGALVHPAPGDPEPGVLVTMAVVSLLGLAGGVLLFALGLRARHPKPGAVG